MIAVVGPAAPFIVQFIVPLHPEAVKFKLPPRHKLRSDGVTVGALGSSFTVVVNATEVPVQPLVSQAA